MKSLILNFHLLKNSSVVILFGILLLAAVLRFWQLGVIPSSPDWDEAALGYNAYSILHTGHDEYGASFPVVLRSFDDYKPAFYAYLTIPSITIFGLNTFAVRLPSAIFGIFTVLFVYLLAKELFKRKDIALLASFLLAISPWHLQFSRVAFETNIGLTLNILGVLLFLKALKKPWILAVSFGIFALNLYAYQSEKVFTPLLAIALICIYARQLIKMPKKILITSCIVGFLVALPMVTFIATNKDALARAAGVSVFAQKSDALQKNAQRLLYDQQTGDIFGKVIDNQRIFYAKAVVGNYLSHWSLNWLFLLGDIDRHHAPGVGLLYLWELPFVLSGIYLLFFGMFDKKTKWIIFLWFVIAPIPASVTTGVPHAVRTLNFLPTFQIFSALGIIGMYSFIRSKKNVLLLASLSSVFGLVVIWSFLYYLNQYFAQTNYFYSADWQYGYQQVVQKVSKMQNDYDKIVVSNGGHMDQSYIFFLFYLKYPPQLFQQAEKNNLLAGNTSNRSFGKYEFRPINWREDQTLTKTLFVGNPDEFPDNTSRTVQTINNIDGTPTMKIVGY